MWVGELPQELWDTWRNAGAGASLGTLEVFAPDAAEKHDGEEAGAGEEQEAESRAGQIVLRDEEGRAWTYRMELVPTAAEDLRVVLSEAAGAGGAAHFALEGVVEQKALVQPCKGRKHAKKPRKHERARAMILDDAASLAPREAPHSLVDAPLQLDSDATSAAPRPRRTRGDRKTVTNAIVRLMTERPQWTKEDLADRLDQPVSFVEEILRTRCDKTLEPVPPTEPYRKPRVVYQLKSVFLRASPSDGPSSTTDTASAASFEPPVKKSC